MAKGCATNSRTEGGIEQVQRKIERAVVISARREQRRVRNVKMKQAVVDDNAATLAFVKEVKVVGGSAN